MPRNFSLPQLRFTALRLPQVPMKDPRVVMRGVIGVLLLANLVAAVIAFKPFGGSAEDLRRQQQELGRQIAQMQANVARAQALANKVEQARTAGDRFLEDYTTDRRVASSTIYAELERAARESGMKPRPLSVMSEPVDGSDTLSQWTVTAAYDGNYADVIKFVNALDKSQRFLIIESMTATPQQSGTTLTVTFKLDAFVRETAGGVS